MTPTLAGARTALHISLIIGSLGLGAGQAAAAINPDDAQSVRDAYAATIASNQPLLTGWTGSTTGCVAGNETHESAAATIANVNFFREMNRLAPVSLAGADINAKAQAAALIFEATNQLSHTPPANWACYSAPGAEAAGRSNIALGIAGANSVGAYVQDAGAGNEPLGHRRWILFPKARVFGTGSTNRSNALWVIDSGATQGPRPSSDLVAWPPPGYVPWPLVYPRWSVSSNFAPGADYSAAQVSVRTGSTPLAVTTLPVHSGYGDNTLAFEVQVPPALQAPQSDVAFDVTVTNVIVNGAARTISYRTTAIGVDTSTVPTAVAPSVTAGTVNVSWQPPRNQPVPITGYRIALLTSGGQEVLTREVGPLERTLVIGTIADGTYRLDVRAVTATGQTSPASRSVIVGTPSQAAPASVTADAPPLAPRGAPALRRVKIVRTSRGRAARVTVRDTTPVAATVLRWRASTRRWVPVRALSRRGIRAGTRQLQLGRLGSGRYRVLVRTPATGARPAGRVLVSFAVR